MRNRTVRVPMGCDLIKTEKKIELLCEKEGLSQKIKRSLKGYSGSTHWHYKRGKEIGTLEITLLPNERKINFSVHENRKGPWTGKYADRLAKETRKELGLEKKSPTL
jgi:hypothetical protein